MRLLLAFAAAQSMGLFLQSSEAFSLAPNQPRPWVSLHSQADDEDVPSDSVEGASLSDEMKEKMKSEDEQYGGGSKFKAMMEQAQSRKATGYSPGAGGQRSMRNPFADNPYAGIEGLDPTMDPAPQQEAQQPAGALDPNALTVEQQAQMFRAMMQGQAAAPPPLSQNVRPPKPDRKVGRNRDADAIQNTADVYFAQLKRDSTVRGIARIRGDEETANAVFKDEKIEELKNMIIENPHLAGQRDAEQKLIETAAEEMIAYQKSLEPKKGNKASSGISYKEKLAARRNKGRGGASAAPSQAAATPAPPKVEKEPKAEAIPEPEPEPVMEAPAVEKPQIQETPQLILEEPPAPAPAPPAAKPAVQAQAPAPAQQSASEWGSPDEIRRGIRTLMGLILKHRGGTGFGAGGLKGEEIGHYENLAEEITALLKQEAASNIDVSAPLQAVTPAVAPAPAPAAPAPAAPQPVATAAVPDTPADSPTEIESMLACIDGAITMYKNSPPELQEGVLMTVRAALLSAVSTVDKALGDNQGIPPATAGAGGSVETMLGCVEGAIMMYRNSPPELQQGVMLTLRAALLSAVNTCNKIIAENDVENFQQYKEATATMEKPPAPEPKPSQFFNVVEAKDVVEEINAAAAMDENSKALEGIYNKLQAAAGDGKMGLRDDLTSEEATDLADSIAEMRSILMDELDTGIPEPEKAPVAVGSAAGSESTGSIYQQMLAQARAAKAAK